MELTPARRYGVDEDGTMFALPSFRQDGERKTMKIRSSPLVCRGGEKYNEMRGCRRILVGAEKDVDFMSLLPDHQV